MDSELLDEPLLEKSNLRRRDLLPIWVKVFIWIFLVFGAIVPLALVFGIMGVRFNLSLYGLETMRPISLVGLFLMILFIFKGVVAFGLWMEREWAVNLAIIDAIIGIIVCAVVMLIIPFLGGSNHINFTIRLELVPLIFYFIKMKDIKLEWLSRVAFKKVY